MKIWEVWQEGFNCTGSRSKAEKLGEVVAETFEDACRFLCKDRLDKDSLSIWGCRLFDNEIDARKGFG